MTGTYFHETPEQPEPERRSEVGLPAPRCFADRCSEPVSHREQDDDGMYWVCARHADSPYTDTTTDCPICPMLATDRDDALNEVAELRRRDKQWAADVVWRANWMTRAVNLLGEIREDLEHELIEAGHLAALEDLLHEKFDDGEADDA